MTELKINGLPVPIEGVEIALTFAAFTVGNPGIRKGSYSNVFEVAKSNEIRKALESAEVVTSLTNIPYQKNEAEIIVDGETAVRGSAILKDVGDAFRVFISAGNSDFFKAVGAARLVDVDLAEYDHVYNAINVTAQRETLDGFVYPNIDYGFFEYADINDTLQPFNFFQPSMWARTIIEKACEFAGYTLKGDILSTLSWRRLVVLCRGAVLDLADNLAQYRHEIEFNQLTEDETEKINFPEKVSDTADLYAFDFDLGQSVYTPRDPSNEDAGFDITLSGKVITNYPRAYTNAFVWVDLLIYNAAGALILTLTNSVRFEDRFFGIFNIYRAPSSGVLEEDINFTYPSVRTERADFLALIAGTSDLTSLRFGWQVRSNRPGAGLKYLRFEGLEFSINQVPRGGGRRSGPNIPIVVRAANVLPAGPTVGDLLLLIANLEGLIIQSDEATKEVHTARLDNMQQRKGAALDWSGKIDLSEEPQISYRLGGIARKNYFRFSGDDNDEFLPPRAGEGVLAVDDANLDAEKELFKSAFAPVPTYPAFSNTRTMGKVFTGDKYTFDGFNFVLNEELIISDFEPRVAILSESEASIQIIEEGNLVNFEVNDGALDFSRALKNNYVVLRSALNRTKIVKALFLLNSYDIKKIDYTRPVFVEHLGEFFYIEQVTQHKINRRESNQVTLIRI